MSGLLTELGDALTHIFRITTHSLLFLVPLRLPVEVGRRQDGAGSVPIGLATLNSAIMHDGIVVGRSQKFPSYGESSRILHDEA